VAREMPWSRASASQLVRSRNHRNPPTPAKSRSAPGCRAGAAPPALGPTDLAATPVKICSKIGPMPCHTMVL
jgi:hypothetical protein